MDDKLFVDIGNTKIKFSFLKNTGELISFYQIETKDLIEENFGKVRDFLNFLTLKDTILVASVVLEKRNTLEKLFSIYNVKLHFIDIKDIPLKIDAHYKTSDKLGVDRVLSSFAVSHMIGQKSFILVSVGTMVTFEIYDVIDGYASGPLFLGCGLQIETFLAKTSIARNYEKLEEYVLANNKTFNANAIASTTKIAVLSGALLGTAAAIDKIVDSILLAKKWKLKDSVLMITGGYVPFIQKYLTHSFNEIENLTTKGLYYLCQR